jgi:hypothetical protein
MAASKECASEEGDSILCAEREGQTRQARDQYVAVEAKTSYQEPGQVCIAPRRRGLLLTKEAQIAVRRSRNVTAKHLSLTSNMNVWTPSAGVSRIDCLPL